MCLGIPGAVCPAHRNDFTREQIDALTTVAVLMDMWHGVESGATLSTDVVEHRDADRFAALAVIEQDVRDALRVCRTVGLFTEGGA